MEFYLYYAELIACYSFLLPLIPGWYFFKSSPLELRLLVARDSGDATGTIGAERGGRHDLVERGERCL